MNIEYIKKELKKLEDPAQAEMMKRFFKTGQGQYGEKDIFCGIKVPVLRRLAKQYNNVSLSDIREFLSSPVHEYRFFALILLVNMFVSFVYSDRKKIYNFYMKNRNYINNWDLVDMSAPKIPGQWLIDNDRAVLYKLARSEILWDRRIAIVSTSFFIQNNQYDDTINIASILLNDNENLIHKAVGWMLREVGKRDIKTEEKFLKQNYDVMPRTMLRYAIEKFPEHLRKYYLKMPRNISKCS